MQTASSECMCIESTKIICKHFAGKNSCFLSFYEIFVIQIADIKMTKNTRKENVKRKNNTDKRKAVESKENEKRKNVENKVEEKRKEAAIKENAATNDVEANKIDKCAVDAENEENPKIKENVDHENNNNKSENTEITSIAVDPAAVKHPLNSKWTLWYYRPEKGREWEECQHKIHDLTSVEEFWSLFNHVRKPSEIQNGGDYSFFKNGIRPMWEDPQNVKGGRLTVIHVSQKQFAMADEVWLDLLVFLIGENFDHTEDVCGMVMNSRSYGYKIAVWTAHSDEKTVTHIGQTIKKSLKGLFAPITFEVHSETQKSSKLYGKASSKIFFTI